MQYRLLSLWALLFCAADGLAGSDFFRIQFIDADTGRGVPLVLARCSHYIEHWSDSAGNVAFLEPGMMHRPIWFSILADGYNFSASAQPASSGAHTGSWPYDSGVTLVTTPGSTATVLLNRTQIAERVYRLTGAGLYRDTVLVAARNEIPASVAMRALEDPQSGSTAQDSLQLAVFKRRVMWLFGDTVCAQSPREANCGGSGMYSVGAQSCVPGQAGCLDLPDEPPSLVYFGNATPTPRPHPIAPIAPLEQNTWVSAFVVLDVGEASESMFGHYYKNPGDGQGQGREGVARWDEERSELVQVAEWPLGLRCGLEGAHTVQHLSPKDRASGHVYFVNGAVSIRVQASKQAVTDPTAYEQLSPAPSNYSCSTVNWNTYAQRYMCVGNRPSSTFGGPSPLYVAWSATLEGPFVNGTLVISHEQSGSSCYNPLQLPHMDIDQGKEVFVACTFTSMWTNTDKRPNLWSSCLFGMNSRQGCAPVVPRYEYNNLVSRIDIVKLLELGADS